MKLRYDIAALATFLSVAVIPAQAASERDRYLAVYNAYTATAVAAQHPLMLVSAKDLVGFEKGARAADLNLFVFTLPSDGQWSLLGYGKAAPHGQAKVIEVAFGGGGRPGDGGHNGIAPNGGVGGTGLDMSHVVQDIGLALSTGGAYTHAPADESNPFGNAVPAGLGGNGGNYGSDTAGGTAVGGNDPCGCTSSEPF
jgi:hypothetical protein